MNDEIEDNNELERVEPSEKERLNPEQVEENLAFDYGNKGSSMDLTQFMDKFLGSERGDFSGKTILSYRQVHLLTRLDIVPDLFKDELPQNQKKAIKKFIDGYEKRLTSIGGQSREDVTDMVIHNLDRERKEEKRDMLGTLFGENKDESE